MALVETGCINGSFLYTYALKRDCRVLHTVQVECESQFRSCFFFQTRLEADVGAMKAGAQNTSHFAIIQYLWAVAAAAAAAALSV